MTFDECIELAEVRISELPPGQYLIGQIYGECWEAIPRHTKLGPVFKDAVTSGRLKGIRWVERKSDNNHLYEITDEEVRS
jgi:hypothetical protein